MLNELNFKQLKSFLILLLSLQKKNTLLGFLIGLVPILVTALSIELFIGKVLGGEENTNGMKGINAIFFVFLSSSILQSTDALKKYGLIIKNSYLQPLTVVMAESLLQYLSFFVSFLIISILFKVSLSKTIFLFLLSIILSIYTILVANYLVVISSILEDFGRVLGIIFQMLFWVSPILYSIRNIKPLLSYIFMINPFFVFFEIVHIIFYPSDFNKFIFTFGLATCASFLIILSILLSNLRKKILVFL